MISFLAVDIVWKSPNTRVNLSSTRKPSTYQKNMSPLHLRFISIKLYSTRYLYLRRSRYPGSLVFSGFFYFIVSKKNFRSNLKEIWKLFEFIYISLYFEIRKFQKIPWNTRLQVLFQSFYRVRDLKPKMFC